jgi:hypothetical protein
MLTGICPGGCRRRRVVVHVRLCPHAAPGQGITAVHDGFVCLTPKDGGLVVRRHGCGTHLTPRDVAEATYGRRAAHHPAQEPRRPLLRPEGPEV